MADDDVPILTDVMGWRPMPGGTHIEIIFSALDGSHHALPVDSGALLHLVPIAAASQPWQAEAECENARTVRTFMDVDRFVLGSDTADRTKLLLSLRLVSGGSLTFHFGRGLAAHLRDVLAATIGEMD